MLTDEEIMTIMAATKLTNLCKANGLIPTGGVQISVARLGFLNLQEIMGMSIFNVDCSRLLFQPDDPPLATVITLPGTQRRPVKPWHMCTITEKVIDIIKLIVDMLMRCM